MSRKWILGIALVGILIISTGAYLLLRFDHSIVPYDPGQYPLQTVEWIINTSRNAPNELTPTPEIWELGIEECRALLRPLLASNDGKYRLETTIYGSYGTPIYSNTGSDEVLIHVAFPDGQRVQIYFYNANFGGC